MLYGREPRLPIYVVLRAPVTSSFSQNFAELIEDSRYLANVLLKETQNKNKAAYDEGRIQQFNVRDEFMVYTPVREVGLSEKLLHGFFPNL